MDAGHGGGGLVAGPVPRVGLASKMVECCRLFYALSSDSSEIQRKGIDGEGCIMYERAR